MNNIKKYCFDLDGVICNNTYGDYENAEPNQLAIKRINKLFYEGNYILIYTSRYMGKFNNDILKVNEYGYETTLKQLKNWGVQFNKLLLGKPEYDYIIDDKSIFFKKNWHKNFKKKYL